MIEYQLCQQLAHRWRVDLRVLTQPNAVLTPLYKFVLLDAVIAEVVLCACALSCSEGCQHIPQIRCQAGSFLQRHLVHRRGHAQRAHVEVDCAHAWKLHESFRALSLPAGRSRRVLVDRTVASKHLSLAPFDAELEQTIRFGGLTRNLGGGQLLLVPELC